MYLVRRICATALIAAVLVVLPMLLPDITQAVMDCSPDGIKYSSSSWLSGQGVNVCNQDIPDLNTWNYVNNSNGVSKQSGYKWECVELINRLYLTKGWIQDRWSGNGNTIRNSAPNGWVQNNGSISYLNPGDVITLDDGGSGHVAIISTVSGNSFTTVNQNTQNVVVSGQVASGSFASGNAHLTINGLTLYVVQSIIHNPNTPSSQQNPGDYTGDNKTDYAVFRPGNSTWYYYQNGGSVSQAYGLAGDIPVTGDYAGDSRSDFAVFRPSNSTWYVYPQGGSPYSQAFGLAGDIPAPADYTGDGKIDYGVFRPSNGTWYYYNGGGAVSQQFGLAGDIPVPGDYGGDGKADYVVFRPSNSTWYVYPQGGSAYSQPFGSSGDIPVPADYIGDNKLDYAVFRPSNGTWYYYNGGGTVSQAFGLAGDMPVPGNYSSTTGKVDYAVFRPSNSTWYVLPQGSYSYSQAFGLSGDIPTSTMLPLPILQWFGLL